METYQDLENTNMNKRNLYGWVFIYNPFKELYEAAKREHKEELWNGDKGNVLRSSSMKTLEEIIIKTNGDAGKIQELVTRGVGKNDSGLF